MTERRATYRLQLRPGFGYPEVTAIIPYLAKLGISHVYTSPYFRAGPASAHGYDVVDHTRINPELGSDEDHARMRRAIREAGLRQLVDVVPNHMRIDRPENRWWWDVLENGQASRYASYFDVDWEAPEEKLRSQVLLPVLADHYGRVLEAGQLTLAREGGRFLVRSPDRAFPVSPRTIDTLLAEAGLHDLAAEAASLPPSHADDDASVRERHERKERLAAELERRAADPAVAERLDAAVARVNAEHDALDELISRQNYRLAFWRVAGQELDYRRFFDITDLAALRVEREHVFHDTHDLVLRWTREGEVDGLRVDHPDGLRDPEEYFERIAAAAPDAWVLAEKILQPGERLPASWRVAGTTGYDWLNVASGLFVDPAAEPAFTAVYQELTGDRRPYDEVLYQSKHDVMRTTLGADLERLVMFFVRICEARRRYRDHTRHDIRAVLRETVACFPAYRSYVRAERRTLTDTDRRMIEHAIGTARERRPDIDGELFDLLRDILLLRITGANEAGLVMRLQQFTAPVTAKGAEDTAFYRYTRLAALCEVGADPSHFGTTLSEFHDHNAYMAEHWPATLLSTATHDTKRAEDVRLRIALLTELPGEWAAIVRRWKASGKRHRRADAPDGTSEHLFWQTLVGAHPLGADRARAFMEKAVREAKTRTSWVRQDAEYEQGVRAFVDGVLADGQLMRDVGLFATRFVRPARQASLALTLLKLTSPGAADIYQGAELWDLSLVDPDNRRPVDLALRARLLDECARLSPRQALMRMEEGVPKLWLIHRALALRARRAEAFAGAYEPLCATGPRGDDVVSYLRGGDVAVVVQRRFLRDRPWGETLVPLPRGSWRDVLSGTERDGGPARATDLLELFPVALLERR